MQVENMEYLLLHSKIQDCYSHPQAYSEFQIHCPSLSQACVASYDQEWCRVQVIGAFICVQYIKQVNMQEKKASVSFIHSVLRLKWLPVFIFQVSLVVGWLRFGMWTLATERLCLWKIWDR